MISSKLLKATNKYAQDLCNRWVVSKLYDRMWEIWYKITVPFREALRLYQWYKNALNQDFDFDSHGIFALIKYKLERLKLALEDGHAIHEPKDMQALKIALKLAERLRRDQYDTRAHDRHDKVWGEARYWFEKVEGSEDRPGGPYSTFKSERPRAVTKEEKDLEKKEYLERIFLADKIRDRETKWLYDVMQKFQRHWWD